MKSLLLMSLLSLTVFGFSQNDWKLVKNKNGIKIYTQKEEGSFNMKLKVITTFHSSLQNIIDLLSDIPAQSDYIYGCEYSKVVKKEYNEAIYYQQSYVPWPFSDRDGYYTQKISYEADSNKVNVDIKSKNHTATTNKKYVRIKKFIASWKLIAQSNDLVQAEYNLEVDPGGSIPQWLINSFIDVAPYKTLIRMKELLKTE